MCRANIVIEETV
ncbi:uncharacterized protein CELE_ZK617.26 [Caenorhabditis elegans]|uniref:Uncharacterized protein n=1 Tax=Caenorhabditis elegans TaxID=6239 RepID=A0A2K5ATY4_CAEEL|nr:Uncharacterized protein CELE_ZK617.26 [Caenorhabditis elegans]SPC47649.1 Uncharacterized protein CELE_ZK617.26 [Caenorhabditis elegans]|eukprot:NP_001348765.1 Uncharacterized protein CELE_ZK617.26 [Caenorhabditis elegans]